MQYKGISNQRRHNGYMYYKGVQNLFYLLQLQVLIRNNELVLGTFESFYAWLDKKKIYWIIADYDSSKNRYLSMSVVFEIVTSNCYYKIDPKEI